MMDGIWIRCKHHFLGWSQESSSPGADRFFKHYLLPHPTSKRGQEAIFTGDRETGHPVSNISRPSTSGCYSFLRCHSFLSLSTQVSPSGYSSSEVPLCPQGTWGVRVCTQTHTQWTGWGAKHGTIGSGSLIPQNDPPSLPSWLCGSPPLISL